MASTKVDIASRALQLMGADSISSLSADGVEANVMNALFDHVYEELLTEAYWNFAKKDATLSKLSSSPTDPSWLYQYQLPSDWLTTVYPWITTSGTEITSYQHQEMTILCSYDGISLKYIYAPDVSELPRWFQNYLIYALAYKTSEKVVSEGALIERLKKDFMEARGRATKQNYMGDPPRRVLRPGTLANARLGGTW